MNFLRQVKRKKQRKNSTINKIATRHNFQLELLEPKLMLSGDGINDMFVAENWNISTALPLAHTFEG